MRVRLAHSITRPVSTGCPRHPVRATVCVTSPQFPVNRNYESPSNSDYGEAGGEEGSGVRRGERTGTIKTLLKSESREPGGRNREFYDAITAHDGN